MLIVCYTFTSIACKQIFYNAAFDTIDHDILITRLSSWFGIHGSVLSWFKSYLSSRCFRSNVKLTCLPGTHPPAVSPRLCPWSTTLRHVHHSSHRPHFLLFPKPPPLCRWHSALSVIPFDSRIDHLHNALDQISSWMTANLLTLNSSKTEFLIIGLSKQLAKINNSSLTTTHSARNLGFIFDEHLTYV